MRGLSLTGGGCAGGIQEGTFEGPPSVGNLYSSKGLRPKRAIEGKDLCINSVHGFSFIHRGLVDNKMLTERYATAQLTPDTLNSKMNVCNWAGGRHG
jgi:hypothetical protein